MRLAADAASVLLAVGWILLHQGHDNTAESSVPDWAAIVVTLVIVGAVLLAAFVILNSGATYLYDRFFSES